MPQPAAPPIVVMSFNRPGYLHQVLDSLRQQDGAAIETRTILLFQDGAVNFVSGVSRADPRDIEACMAIFRKAFPNGEVFVPSHNKVLYNLGVAANFKRAEEHVFAQGRAEAAIFLEDDMVLTPNYIAAVDALLRVAAADERIGYVAAYGRYRLSLAEQYVAPKRYTPLDHNWGFGLTRRQWLKSKPYVDACFDIMVAHDYRVPPEREIHRLFRGWGFGYPGCSQDIAKSMACCLTGSVKLNITACLAKYIGARGIHMTEATYAERAYARTEIFPEPLNDFPPLADAEYNAILAAQRRWAAWVACRFDDEDAASASPR